MFRSVWTGATYLDENYAGLHGDVRPGRYAFDHLVVFETVAMQMSSRYVRCAPNVVDDRSRDHHAERSSVLGKCFWPPIVRLDAPIVPSIAGTAMPLAAAPYRASGLVLWHQTDLSVKRNDVCC
jgi:hypothetical protein